MKAIPRYVLFQLIAVTLTVTAVLTLAVWLIRSLRFIDLIVNRGLPLDTFLWLVLLLLPTFLGVALPIATFCAVLFVYNKLTMDSEMVVMRAAGLSQLQLAMPALLVAMGATAIVYSITLYFQPASYHVFKNLQAEIEGDMAAAFIQDGVFEDLRKGLTLYVRERDSDGVLHGVLLHDTRDPQSPVTILAERATLLQDDTGSEAVLFDGTRQELNAADGRMTSLTFDRYTFDLRRVEQPTQRPWRNLKERYLHELLTPGPSKAEQRLRNELIAEGHQRLILPLYVIAFVAVGLAALLSGEFNRRGQAWRVALAIGLVAFLEGLQLALRDFAGREPAGIFAMYAAVILSTVAAFYIFLQGHRQTFSLPRWRKAAVP